MARWGGSGYLNTGICAVVIMLEVMLMVSGYTGVSFFKRFPILRQFFRLRMCNNHIMRRNVPHHSHAYQCLLHKRIFNIDDINNDNFHLPTTVLFL